MPSWTTLDHPSENLFSIYKSMGLYIGREGSRGVVSWFWLKQKQNILRLCTLLLFLGQKSSSSVTRPTSRFNEMTEEFTNLWTRFYILVCCSSRYFSVFRSLECHCPGNSLVQIRKRSGFFFFFPKINFFCSLIFPWIMYNQLNTVTFPSKLKRRRFVRLLIVWN